MAQAYLLYSEAAAMDPDKKIYWLRAEALRTRAAMEAKVRPKAEVDAAPEPPPEPDPDIPPIETPTEQDYIDARKPLPPTKLNATPGRKDFDLRADSKKLFETVAKAYGLDTIFDGDYQPTPALRFQMEQADYREALHALEAVTGSFIVPLSDRLFMIVKDTPQKRREVEPTVSISVPLPEPTNLQDMTALITAVQQSLGLEKVAWDSQKNTVVIRDRISKVYPARQLIQDLLYPRAQVEVEVRFLEVNRQDLLSYGLSLPTSFPISYLGGILNSPTSLPSSITNVLLLGGGSSLFGIGIADAQAIATMSKSDSRTLLSSDIRSIDGQPATFHVGDKYPIMTSGYYGPQDFSSGGSVYTPPPSFTFEDLGLSIKLTPHVHGMRDVTLELETEFAVLGGKGYNGIPIISNRQLKASIRLREGEWALVAGMMSTSEARTISGIAGLAQIPYLGALFSRRDRNKSSDEVLIAIKPKLITLPPEEVVTKAVPIGTEQRPLTPL